MDIGLLVLRLAVGLTMAAHGGQKLFGWFGGYGIAGTGGWLESIGFRPGKVQAVVAGTFEFAGGLLIALGLLTPLGTALVIAGPGAYSLDAVNGFQLAGWLPGLVAVLAGFVLGGGALAGRRTAPVA